MTNKSILYFIPLYGILTIYQAEASENGVEIGEQEEITEQDNEAQLYDFGQPVTFEADSTAILGTGIFRGTSGLFNYSTNVKLRPNSILTLAAGDGVNTGVFYNYGTVKLYKNSKVTGGGVIIERGGLLVDNENTERAKIKRDEYDQGYLIDDYDTLEDLVEQKDIQNAAYFDLANDESLHNDEQPTTTFKKFYTGGIFTTDKTIEEATENDFVKLTDSARGSGEQGKIDESIVFKSDMGNFNQTKETENTACELGVAAQNFNGCNAIHVSDKQDDIKMSFLSVPGFNIGMPEDPDNTSQFTFGAEKIPVWLPKVDENVILGKTMPDTEKAEEYEQDIMETLNNEDNSTPFAYKDWEADDPVTTYHGDNSWFNGVYKLKRGGMIVKNTAGMFGGRVELGDADSYESPLGNGVGTLALHADLTQENEKAKEFIKTVKPTEFEWEGGAKDEYNKPHIYMNGNSTLFFNLQPDQDGNEIFSFYGNITGSERDRLIFEQGEVRIKGDCSGFKGSVAVIPGAKFEVRSSDEGSSSKYEGKFPNANIYQVYGADSGENAGKFVTTHDAVTSVDTATMENVTINNGNMELYNGGTDNDGKITLKSTNIESSAMATLNDEAEIKDTVIKGVLVAKGDMTVENTTLQGGVLVLENGSILATNSLNAGSTIASWGNDRWQDVVNVGGGLGAGHFNINQNHTLKLFSDYNVTNDQADSINVVAAIGNVQVAGGIAVAGMNFNEMPTKDTYTFMIYNGNGRTDNMPVTIGGEYNNDGNRIFKAYVNGQFYPTNPAGNVNLNNGMVGRQDDVKFIYTTNAKEVTAYLENNLQILEFDNGNIYKVEGQAAGQYSNVVMTKYLSENAIASDVVQDAVINEVALNLGTLSSDTDDILNSSILSDTDFGVFTHGANSETLPEKLKAKKYRIWNKTFGEHSKIDMKGTDNINMNGAGTMIGVDDEEEKCEMFNGEATFRPTYFAGLSHNNLKYKGDKYGVNGYFCGAKVAMYDKNQVLEASGIYQYLRGGATLGTSTSKQKIKPTSHVLNVTAKYAHNFKINHNLFVRPSCSIGYSFIDNPTFEGYNGADHEMNNRHVFSFIPEISVLKKRNDFLVRGYVSFYDRIGTKGKTKATEVTAKTDLVKKGVLEYGAEVTKTYSMNTSYLSFKLARKTLATKGFKATISAGIKF